MAEQRTHKPSVVGSSPTLATEGPQKWGLFIISCIREIGFFW